MTIRPDLEYGVAYLQDADLLKLTASSEIVLVKQIPPDQLRPAFTWLVWAALVLEPQVEPPTYQAALDSRRTNIDDVFRFEEVLREKISGRDEKLAMWRQAGHKANMIQYTSLGLARTVLSPHLAKK